MSNQLALFLISLIHGFLSRKREKEEKLMPKPLNRKTKCATVFR